MSKVILAIALLVVNCSSVAAPLIYTCTVTNVYDLSDNGALRLSGFKKQFEGSTFSVSRTTGEIVGEVLPTLNAKVVRVVNSGSTTNSFKAVADFGQQMQLIEIQEFHMGVIKPFVSSSMGGAGIVTGTCQ